MANKEIKLLARISNQLTLIQTDTRMLPCTQENRRLLNILDTEQRQTLKLCKKLKRQLKKRTLP